jgi:hypothetical protein
MKRAIKLFLLVFVFGFLVGCGGGGSGSSQDEKKASISFAEVEAAFPAFPNVSGLNASLDYVGKSKLYVVTQDMFNSFNASILGNYTDYGYMHERQDQDVKYHVDYDISQGTLQMDIIGFLNFEDLTDSVFESEFGSSIDGSLDSIFIVKGYDANISLKYDAYTVSLANHQNGFRCTNSPSTGYKYDCRKTSSNGLFTYFWAVSDDFSYEYGAIVN